MIIELPTPCLVLLVGAAGSGKSTLAARLFDASDVLSSDAHRAMVSGDAADQSVTRVAFAILNRELERRLAARRATTVIDATNVTSFARRSLLRLAARHSIPVIGIVLDLDPALVQARNATRLGRIVPSEAVGQQLEALGRSMRRAELGREGFAAVYVLRTPVEVDEVTIART